MDREPPDISKLNAEGRPVCVGCDKPLRAVSRSEFWRFNLENIQPYGWKGNAMFCSQRCAAEWAIAKASTGDDAVASTPTPEVPAPGSAAVMCTPPPP